jgi:dolichyl-phosphate beta-glucosyltransferase
MTAFRGGPGGRGLTSLIFPTYNPGRSLEQTWPEVRRFLGAAPGEWEAVYVCDGCTDGTPARLAEWAADEGGRLRVLSYAPNRGKGYAVRRGLAEAAGAWRIFTDVDLSYGLDGVLRVAEGLWAGAEVVVGSRAHADSTFIIPSRLQDYAYWRRLQSWCFSAVVSCLLPLKQSDTQAGLKGFSAAALRAILPRLRCDGFAFDCELLLACLRCGLSVAEAPVHFRYWDRSTTTNLGKAARMFREVCQIRREFRREGPGAGPAAEAPASGQKAA